MWSKLRCGDMCFIYVPLMHVWGFIYVESAFPSLLCLTQPCSCLLAAVSQSVLSPKDSMTVLFLGPLLLAFSDI